MKTLISLTILFCLGLNSMVFAQTAGDSTTQKVRETVAKIGTGKSAKVEVGFRDSTRRKGFIGAINKDSFSLVDEKSGAASDVAFADVEKVKKRGGLSKGGMIAIIAEAGAAAAIVIGILVVRCRNEGGCGGY